MRRPLLDGAVFLVLLQGLGSAALLGQTSEDPDALLRAGAYERAIEVLGPPDAPPSASPEASLRLADVLLEVGEHERAESVLRGALDGNPGHAGLTLLLGKTLVERGHLEEADRAFAEAELGEGGDALLAELHRAELLLRTGRRELALERFDRFIDVYNRSAGLDSRGLLAVAGAVRQLGVTNPVLYRDALRAYDEAIAQDPENFDAHLGVGELFLETYNAPDARGAFQAVLERRARHPRALLGMSRVAILESSPESAALVEAALEVNPNLVPALVTRARLQLAAEADSIAREDLNRALAVNPTSSEALAVLAGLRFLQGDLQGYEEARGRALEMNPRDSDFFITVAELAAQRRFYADAVQFAKQGTAVDSLAWEAFGLKGLNQLRTGEIAEGRSSLEVAFRGDPYNIWFKNTLDLLDVMDDFEEWGSDRVRVWVDPEDGEALATYMVELGERALDDLGALYGYDPPVPVRVEAFRRSADFSVRTIGLTGLGALGVSFGPVVALESPAIRQPGGFHWAATLWHELAHTVHLGVTDHRVPRWITEGLAVREERRAGTGWGARPSLTFFSAYLDGRIRDPSELSRSFIRPRHPQEVAFAYVLSSLVTEWIEEEWGFDAVLGILHGYGEGRTTEAVIRRELGIELPELDERFDTWFRETYATPLDGRDELEASIRMGRELLEEGRFDEAIPHLERARDLFPENPDPRGPNHLLAQAHRELGNEEELLGALEVHIESAGSDYDAHLKLAELREARGESERAIMALEAAIHITPFDLGVHRRLAALYREVGHSAGEVREYRVALALEPTDRAGALHRLADAQFRAGELAEARETVLQALELAPLFSEAQDLLLRILDEQ